ncbi:hypothetical protein [Amycolatopsis thermoflava]|uniref:hypothetical protein n=1 Tax=Amycolatopsis thermoflava TaxID=84480 RepID=UPI003EB6E491
MTDLGELRRQPDGLAALVFERHLKHPPEKVWRALTEPGELATWFPVHVLDFAVHVLRFAAERGAPAAGSSCCGGNCPGRRGLRLVSNALLDLGNVTKLKCRSAASS